MKRQIYRQNIQTRKFKTTDFIPKTELEELWNPQSKIIQQGRRKKRPWCGEATLATQLLLFPGRRREQNWFLNCEAAGECNPTPGQACHPRKPGIYLRCPLEDSEGQQWTGILLITLCGSVGSSRHQLTKNLLWTTEPPRACDEMKEHPQVRALQLGLPQTPMWGKSQRDSCGEQETWTWSSWRGQGTGSGWECMSRDSSPNWCQDHISAENSSRAMAAVITIQFKMDQKPQPETRNFKTARGRHR